ncbi:AAA family ATPase [Thermodesulfobacteriota bacterium]
MYKNFFGFKERPFKLVPNPAYLFLSKSHEEALAHLTYATTQGDGFVEITGEVGTGKTTLCRAFLENLDEYTEAAYIFNPKLDSIQLLKAVNDEFGISSDSDNTKGLIDTLNTFLIEKKAEGKNVILLIDEAQNLTEDVLEQLRLLSNLETTRHKLLQIILVGQPELGEKFDSYELRQLAQRINLRCQLLPLNYKEVRDYIQHRINIASRKPGIKFSRAAYRFICQYSRGIPRLINIVCDRALLSAFGSDQQKITGRIANSAIRELAGRGGIKHRSYYELKKTFLYFFLLSLSLFLLFLHSSGRLDVNTIFRSTESKTPDISKLEHPNAPDTKSLVSNPKPSGSKTIKKSEEYVAPVRDFANYLMEMDTRSSRHMALGIAMGLWHIESEIKPSLHNIDDDHTFLRLAAKQNGFLIRRIEGDLNIIKRLNLPAILALHPSEDLSPVYLAVIQTDDNKIVLRSGVEDSVMAVEPDDLESCWSGVAYIPWKNFFSLTGTIPLDAPGDTIITLKMLLRDIGYNEIEISPVFDEDTQQAIKNIQKKHGIGVDGIVGSSTKIVLYNEKKSLEIPHITSQ